MSNVPTAIAEALKERVSHPSPERVRTDSSKVQRGDLRFVSGPAGVKVEPRLILVLSVESRLNFVEVLLVHTASEMACDVDALIPPSLSGTPYPVVVQTDIRGAVWTQQLGPAVGRLDESTIQTLSTDLARQENASSEMRRGIPLAGPIDPRWTFKADEGASFMSLTSDCTEALLDGGSWLVEPGLLRPELLDLADDPPALIAELVHWVTTRQLEVSPSDIELLLEVGALDLNAWAALGDLGLDLWSTVQDLIERSATTPSHSADETTFRIVTASHLETRAWVLEPDAIHYLGQKETADV